MKKVLLVLVLCLGLLLVGCTNQEEELQAEVDALTEKLVDKKYEILVWKGYVEYLFDMEYDLSDDGLTSEELIARNTLYWLDYIAVLDYYVNSNDTGFIVAIEIPTTDTFYTYTVRATWKLDAVTVRSEEVYIMYEEVGLVIHSDGIATISVLE